MAKLYFYYAAMNAGKSTTLLQADYNYREYYRDIGYELSPEYLEPFQYAKGIRTHTGIKYHRITGPTHDKELYNRAWAMAARTWSSSILRRVPIPGLALPTMRRPHCRG